MAKSDLDASPDTGMAEVRALKAGLFRALANPTRIHIVELLHTRNSTRNQTEVPVSELLAEIGVEPANLSQHLGVLRNHGMVTSRKEGTQVFCRLGDGRIGEVIELMKRICEADLQQSLTALQNPR